MVVLCRQVLPAYWFGDWHWAAAHVLCLVGAVLGSIGSFAWQAHANSITEGGAPTWLVSSLPCQDPSMLNCPAGHARLRDVCHAPHFKSSDVLFMCGPGPQALCPYEPLRQLWIGAS